MSTHTLSTHTLSTYTVRVPVRQVSLRQRVAAYRTQFRTRAELRSVLSGDLGPAQRGEAVAALGRHL